MAQDNVADMPESREQSARLREAMRKARLTEAERSDVIVDLREAEMARLELLQDAVADVFASIPPDTDLLECTLVPGSPPRLWIDVLAYVCMGRDKRTYRFIKESRYGRQVILETAQLEEVAGRITDYVAHRIIERQRALESDEDRRLYEAGAGQVQAAAPNPEVKRAGWGAILGAFILGLVLGAVGLFAGALLIVSV